MTQRELDMLVIGLAVGGLTCLWLGYRLRVRVERWQARRVQRYARRHAKQTAFPSPGYGTIPAEQSVHRMLRSRPRVIPLDRRSPSTEGIPVLRDLDKIPIAPIPVAHLSHRIPYLEADEAETARITERMIRSDAVNALVGAGFKKADASAALDACTLVERAGGLESWVAAALRRAVSKP